uniref:Uncharacterized protein n=1 Tax=Podoviridae sp. ct8Lf7 TaxID=2827723 RepID=A0A8S5S1J9_9CAUD|nr:MAG TPA: hypothetical protein [Podoviridae sp. ct8Lf7]
MSKILIANAYELFNILPPFRIRQATLLCRLLQLPYYKDKN